MVGKKEIKAPDWVLNYWRNKRAAGGEIPPVYVVIHLKGSLQPEGYIQAGDISLARAGALQKRVIKDAKPHVAKTKIILLKPENYEF